MDESVANEKSPYKRSSFLVICYFVIRIILFWIKTGVPFQHTIEYYRYTIYFVTIFSVTLNFYDVSALK